MKKMINILLILLGLYVTILSVLYFSQEKLIFLGIELAPDHIYTFEQPFEEVDLKTPDGETINALHFTTEDPKGVILYFHGNHGNLDRWGNIVSYFTHFNHDVFIVDYRSYGKSTGKPNEKLMYKDALLSYDYLNKHFDSDQITIYGRSLGGTFAIKVAAERKVKQLILEAPFYNLADVAKKHYPFIPFTALLKYKLASNKMIDKVTCKTTMFHGTEDVVVPISSSQKLFDKTNKKHTQYVTIDGGTHHNLREYELYQNTIKELLN